MKLRALGGSISGLLNEEGFGQRPVVVSAPGPFMTLFWFVRVPRFCYDRDTAPCFQSLSIPQ